MNPKTLPSWLDRGLHFLIGAVFLVSGWIKASHPALMASHFQYRLEWFPNSLAWPTIIALATIEILFGLMLATRFHATWARKAAAVLLGVFVLYLLASIFFGVQTPCQCYGNLIQLSPLTSLGLDIGLLSVLALLQRRGGQSKRKGPFIICLLAILTLVGLSRVTSTFDGSLIQTKPGLAITTLPSLHPEAVNRMRPRLVMIVNRSVDAGRIGRLQMAYPQFQIVILYSQSEPTFVQNDIVQLIIKPELTALFAKSFPTSFTLNENIIETVWYGQYPPD